MRLPVLAQTTAVPTYTQNGQTPNNSGSGAGPIDPLKDATPGVDNCRQLMEKAKSMTAPTNPDRADAAEKELALAVDARERGDYAACRDHSIAAMEAKK
ncbi:MAG: hypothetical protein WDM89_00960 [Rhizomicrobium sp.]